MVVAATTTTTPKPKGYALPAPRYAREAFVASTASEALRKLSKHGVAVVPGLLDKEEWVRRTRAGVLEGLEAAFPGFRRDDASTWRLLRDHGAKHAQLLQEHGLGWMQAAVDVRQHPAVAGFFAALWEERLSLANPGAGIKVTDMDLFSSADAVSVYLNTPDSKGGFHREGHDWLHWDRSPSDAKCWSVQGFVHLSGDTVEGGAAFQCLTRTHRLQEGFAARFPETRSKRFHLLEGQAQADFFLAGAKVEHVCVAARTGDLVLWDSRTIHCGRAAGRASQKKVPKRMVVYVSMQPKRFASRRDVELKRRAHAQLRCTSHNAASGVELFAKYPRVRCARDEALRRAARPVAAAPRLTALGRSLFALAAGQ